MSYVLLWDVEERGDINDKLLAYSQAMETPPPPSDPISPVPRQVDIGSYGIHPVKPVRPLGGRKTRRGGTYAGLSNYNTIP